MKVCKNCGGEEGLHEYETFRCPRNGQESPVGRPQLWQNTYLDMSDDEIELLNAKVVLLLTAVENILKRIEDLEEEFYAHERKGEK